jgi:hypothetical protein
MPLKPETTNELRGMVRDVLREVMAQRSAPALSSGAAVETVRITNDAELAQFVSRLIDQATAEKVRSGKLRFTLSQMPVQQAPQTASGEALTGVVTEQKIDRLVGHGRIVLAPGAVLTPLARDKARKLGLTIERRR